MNGNERTMRSAITLGLGIMIAAAAPGALAQVSPSTPNRVKSALQGAAKPAQQPAQPAAKPAAPAAKKVAKAATPRATAPAQSEVRMARRDPFESLVGRQQGKGAPNLPPGKAGLQVNTLRLDGIVKA